MRALIICNDFPPLNSIGADRPYSWYLYFKKNGIEPIIITKNWISEVSNYTDIIDNISNIREIQSNENGIIIKVPHNTIVSEKLIKRYGISHFQQFRKVLTFIYKLLSFHFFFFDQHRYLYSEAVSYLKNNSVDFIITTGEPFILFKYGMKLKKQFNIKWIADYRDGWYLNHVTSISSNIFVKLLRWNEYNCEKRYLKHVDLISTVDPLLAEKLEKLHSKKTVYSYNGFWEIYSDNQMSVPKSKLILTHTGTLTPGQRVEFLLQAIDELLTENRIQINDIELQFVGLEYFPIQNKRVLSYSNQVTKCIVTTPRIPSEQAIIKNQESDFLLTFTEETNAAIYAKTYTYIACKKPILVIPDDNSILGNLITKYSLGFVFSSIEELKNKIEESVRLKHLGQLHCQNVISDEINFFSREIQVKEFVSNLLLHFEEA